MPQVEIQEPSGSYWRCDSSNPDTIAAFLLERAQNLVNANPAFGDIRVTIRPGYVWSETAQNYVSDWPIGRQRDWFIAPDQFIPRLIELLQIEQVEQVDVPRSLG